MAALRREDVTGDGITEQIVAEVQLRGWKVLHGRGCHKTQELLLYDHMGNITSPTEGGENTTLYACDLSGNMVTITDPTGEKELYSYDKEGHVAEKTDRNGITTQYAFNMYGAPIIPQGEGRNQSGIIPVYIGRTDEGGNIRRNALQLRV